MTLNPITLALSGLAVGTLVILGALVARADDTMWLQTTPHAVMTIPACREPLSKLPALAARLGVKEWDPKTGDAEALFSTCDGHSYSVVTLLNALLDRMDKAAAR